MHTDEDSNESWWHTEPLCSSKGQPRCVIKSCRGSICAWNSKMICLGKFSWQRTLSPFWTQWGPLKFQIRAQEKKGFFFVVSAYAQLLNVSYGCRDLMQWLVKGRMGAAILPQMGLKPGEDWRACASWEWDVASHFFLSQVSTVIPPYPNMSISQDFSNCGW